MTYSILLVPIAITAILYFVWYFALSNNERKQRINAAKRRSEEKSAKSIPVPLVDDLHAEIVPPGLNVVVEHLSDNQRDILDKIFEDDDAFIKKSTNAWKDTEPSPLDRK